MEKKNFFKQKRQKFKQKREKFHLEFDANDRKDFLTGFHKRKAERRIKAKEELEKEIKEEKLRIKQKQKERLNELYDSQRTVPEVQHLLEPTITYELPEHFVNITTFDANDISGTLGRSLGLNKTDNSLNTELNSNNYTNHSNDSDSDGNKDLPQKIIDVKKSLRKQRIDSIKSSKAFQLQQKIKRNKDITKSKHRKKLLKKDMKEMKIKSLAKNKAKKKKINSRKNKKFSSKP